MGKVFKQLYEDTASSENARKDICLALSILLSTCLSAKSAAIDQNLMRKVVDVARDNASAIYLLALAKISKDKNMFQKESRRLKHVVDMADQLGQERELTRMLTLIRSTFYDSRALLAESFTQKVQDGKKKASQADRLMGLFAQITEEIGSSRTLEPLFAEAVLTMVNFASQNRLFKNCFTAMVEGKRVSVLKMLCEQVDQRAGSTSRTLRLLFTLLRSLSVSPDVAKDLTRLRFLDDWTARLTVQIKSEKDVKLNKFTLGYFFSMLAAFATSEEGQKHVAKVRQLFDFSVFLLESISLPAVMQQAPDMDLSPMCFLVL
jgi:hypothetical protein